MSQQVTVMTDAPVDLKPLLESAIRSELQMLELSLARTTERLHTFEAQYGMPSEEFIRRFEASELDESLDYIEWAGEVKTYHLLRTQQQALHSVHLQCDVSSTTALLTHTAPESAARRCQRVLPAP
jgi:hypothetical protein